MSEVEALFRGAKRKTATRTVCLAGDLAADFDTLEDRLAETRQSTADSLAGREVRTIVAQMDAIRDQMTAAEVTFRFASLRPGRPLALLAEHSPREGSAADKMRGYNEDTYPFALVRESCISVQATGADPVDSGDIADDAWEALYADLGHSDFDILVSGALEANGRTSVPFSRIASAISQSNADASKSPTPGASPRKGSTAGSRPRKRSTPTTKPGS